ncbi:MAG: hypothetical protein ACI8PP_001488 [Candidatus Pseudothioglobus sp.]|jgi:hypothetical protein
MSRVDQRADSTSLEINAEIEVELAREDRYIRNELEAVLETSSRPY